MTHALYSIIVNDDRLADLHKLREAAGLSRITNKSMLQLCLTNGMQQEAESLLMLAPEAALATVPAEYRDATWTRAEKMLASLRAKGGL